MLTSKAVEVRLRSIVVDLTWVEEEGRGRREQEQEIECINVDKGLGVFFLGRPPFFLF